MAEPTSTITLSDRIKTARKFAGLSQKALADRVEISQTAILRLESGSSRSSKRTIAIALACGVDPIWLETGRGEMSLGGPSGEGYRVPVIARIPLITWDEAKIYTQAPQNVKAWIPVAPRTSSAAYALEVPDDSMEPEFKEGEFKEGEIVIVDPTMKAEREHSLFVQTAKALPFPAIKFGKIFKFGLKWPKNSLKTEKIGLGSVETSP